MTVLLLSEVLRVTTISSGEAPSSRASASTDFAASALNLARLWNEASWSMSRV